jgi:hypothetical protein
MLWLALVASGCDSAEVQRGANASFATSDAMVRHASQAVATASGSLEANDGAASEPDWLALEACADTATRCFEDGTIGATVCIDTYVACAVGAGVSAADPSLGCLSTLARCLETASDEEAAEVCVGSYEGCIESIPVPVGDGPGDDVPPSDLDSEDPLDACTLAADACLMEADPADGPAQAACLGGYGACLEDIGVDPAEPYLGCLAEAEGCFAAAGANVDGCWDAFGGCVDAAYPHDSPPEHDPEDDEGDAREPSLCEPETMACYEAGGSNAACLRVFATCLVDAGVPEDEPYLVCVEALIVCAEPAESGPDPDAALEVCADDFQVCLDTHGIGGGE